MDTSPWAIRLPERGMKVLRFPPVRLVLALVFFIAFLGVAYGLAALTVQLTGADPEAGAWIVMIFTCSFAVAGYLLYCHTIEGRKAAELSPARSLLQLGSGFLLGFGFISLVMAVMGLAGGYRIEGFRSWSALWPILVMSVQAAVVEEILSRGILFRIAEEGIGTVWSVLLSAFIFGFLHSWNPNATVFSSVSIALTAGVILALLYVITRKLWVPIGLHAGWNLTLGGLYGAPVSGGEPGGILRASFSGPDWLTGGSFGPEASVITLAVFLLFGAALVRKISADKSWIKPLWRKIE